MSLILQEPHLFTALSLSLEPTLSVTLSHFGTMLAQHETCKQALPINSVMPTTDDNNPAFAMPSHKTYSTVAPFPLSLIS